MRLEQPEHKVAGSGAFTPPAGMTVREAEAIARAADAARQQGDDD